MNCQAKKVNSKQGTMMSSKLVGALAIVVSFSLTGCLGQNVKPQQDAFAVPDIALEAPRDNSQYYYAVGEGETAELAKNNALSQISSRISVSVSASITNEHIVRTDNNQSQSSELTKSKVNATAKTIQFSGVSVEETENVDGLKQVLVKVDRNVLFQSYQRKLEALDDKVKKEISIFNRSAVFSQLKLSYDIQALIDQAREEITLLKAMRPSYDDKSSLDRYSDYEDSIRGVKQKAVFSITSDNNSQSLATLLKNYLSEENIKMGKKGANVKLHITTQATDKKFKTSNSKLANLKIVNRVSSLKVKDSKGVVLSNNIVKTKASSSASREDAIQQTKQYEKLISRDGVLSFISGKK